MLRRCIVAIGVSASLAWPCTAGLAEIPKLDFKRLDDPYAPRSPAHLKLRPRLDISRVADAAAAPGTSPRPTDEIGNLAKLRTVPVLGEGLVVTTGAMRNMRDIDREIDRAVLASPLGEDPTGLGQAKTVYVGIGYDNGRIAEPGWHLRLSAGASGASRSSLPRTSGRVLKFKSINRPYKAPGARKRPTAGFGLKTGS